MTNQEKWLKENFPYEVGTSNYLINISNKNKIIYFETPKVACSTIKRTLQTLEVDDISLLSKDVHDKSKTPLLSPLSLVHPLSHHLESYFLFGFVRNPYSRILSCYLDKIVGNQWERERRLPKIGYEASDNLTFIEFLKAIKKFPIEKWDIHWMPQTVLLANDKVDLNFIGRQETFDSDFNRLLQYFNNGEQEEKKIVNINHHSVNANKKLEKYLNKEAQNLIKEIYYNDFKAYGYGFDPLFT